MNLKWNTTDDHRSIDWEGGGAAIFMQFKIEKYLIIIVNKRKYVKF